MGDGLLDAFRHNTWATVRLVDHCGSLTQEQLQATAPGTYGSILATLQHIVGAENHYLWRLSGEQPPWPREAAEAAELGEIGRMAGELGRLWEQLLTGPLDGDELITGHNREGSAFEVRSGVIAAQNLNHGNEHRSQVATILTTLGIDPPEIDGWAWGQATGRFSIEDAS